MEDFQLNLLIIVALGQQEKERAALKDPNKDANKRHTMSHPPDHIPDLESPTRGSRSPIKKEKKERVSISKGRILLTDTNH